MQPVEWNRILAAVDFSDWTTPVLRVATEVAARYGAGLTVAHAERFLPPPYFTRADAGRLVEALSLQREATRRILEEGVAKGVGARVPAQAVLVEAAPADGILTAAAEAKAGLIVMGTHGLSGLNRLLMGSVAEKVVRQARVPVLTVRGGDGDPGTCRLPFRRILCPVNYADVAADALRVAADLARRFQAKLTVATVVEKGAPADTAESHERRLCGWVPSEVQATCAFRPLVRQGDPAEQILLSAKETESDLVVIGAQHRKLLDATILGTTSIRVLRHAACPVLTVFRH